MNAAELKARVIGSGADEAGIRDRFKDNDELYQLCFIDFLEEPNVTALRQAMAEQAYETAFEAAHALKGVSGNLGLTAYYEAICILVESLRAKSYGHVDEEFAEVERHFRALRALTETDAPVPQGADETPPEEKNRRGEKTEKKERADKKPHPHGRSYFLPASAAVLAVVLVFMFFLFNRLTFKYKDNVTTESASHLAEISYQICGSVEDGIENDWMLAHTVGLFLSSTHGISGEEEILHLLRSIAETWKVSDVCLYTESGDSLCLHGGPEARDVTSNRAARARERGEYMTIVDSDITYTVPVETSLTYRDSPVVALSIVKNMASFLDEMEFSSFNNKAYMYLTDDTGKVFSRLTTGASAAVFNVMPLFDEELTSAITNEPVPKEVILTAEGPLVLITGNDYVTTTDIRTRQNSFRLIYIVPMAAVNATMENYTSSVTATSLIVLFFYGVCALAVIVYQYRNSRKRFASAILARERMFDLLVRNTSTAFGLFQLNDPKPLYISDNSMEIVTVPSPALLKGDEGYSMGVENGETVPVFRELNEGLKAWDGMSPFRSGFIQDTTCETPRFFEVQLFPIEDATGEYVGIAQDVTSLQAREDAIRAALKLAEESSQAKTRFLSNMSHDIRTPMNAIVNMADFAIEEMDKPEKLRDDLMIIRESSDHLLLLINDILEMSRIESGKTEMTVVPFDLRAELTRLKSVIKPLCEEKQQTLYMDIEDLETDVVKGDRVKVSRILMNLLSNAVKFTPEHGAVRFTARELPSMRDAYVYMRFTVEDTGIGMSARDVEHVFEPFFRADEKRVTSVPGTGLGLAICWSYVQAMGGQLQCRSEENEGSVFTVDLYFQRTDTIPESRRAFTAQDVKPFIGLRCLLCEDNPTNQRIAAAVLTRLGFRVDAAENGMEGLSMFMQSAPGHYDVVYMDIQMPIMDGYETAVAIRNCDREDARTLPIIAMTANVFMEDIEKAHIAGMNGHVGKPISTAAIADETERVLQQLRRTK